MSTPFGVDQCLSFVQCNLQQARGPIRAANGKVGWRAVTISRQAGSGAHVIADRLAQYLAARATDSLVPWTVVDRNLVDKVIEEHRLPPYLGKFLREDRIPAINDMLEELCGLHPPALTLLRKIAQTILHLVERGNVIIIGRGANVVTRKLDYVLNLRLVGSLEKRIAYIQSTTQMGLKEASAFVQAEDRGRRRYARKYFNVDIDNPLLYHMVINTDMLDYDRTARALADMILPLSTPKKTSRAESVQS